MDPHFVHAVAHCPDVAGMAHRQAPQPGIDPGDRAPVAQGTYPALERGAFDDFDHPADVNHGSHPVKCESVPDARQRLHPDRIVQRDHLVVRFSVSSTHRFERTEQARLNKSMPVIDKTRLQDSSAGDVFLTLVMQRPS